MTRPLYDLPRAKPMNERLWTREVPDPPITPVGDVQNAATARDVSSAIAGQPLTGMLVREDLKVPKKETTMSAPTADALKAYLIEHGPTTREVLRDALGYTAHYSNADVARTMLNKHIRDIGAASATRLGPVVLPQGAGLAPDAPPASRAKRQKPVEPAPTVVRPTLFAAVRDAIREANATGAHLELEPAFVNALHLRLVEAGL